MLATMSEKVDNLASALVKSQASMSSVVKDKKGASFGFKYVDLPQVLEIIKTAITPHDLSFIQLLGPVIDNKVTIESILLHTSGQFISCVSETFIEESEKRTKAVSAPQNVGASVTYLRRKAALAFFSIAEEDEIDNKQRQPEPQQKRDYPRAGQEGLNTLPNPGKRTPMPTAQHALTAPGFTAGGRGVPMPAYEVTPISAPVASNVQSISSVTARPAGSDTLVALRRLINQASVPAITGKAILEKSKVEKIEDLTEAQAKAWIVKLQETAQKQA